MYRLITSAMGGAAMVLALGLADVKPAVAQDVKEIRWATSSVGSSGHRALVALANLLNKEMPELEVTVLPTPGAAATVRGFASGEFDGFYGADIAFHEIAEKAGRYKDFDASAGKQLTQSFWAFTLEIGLCINADDADEFKQWRDLNGKPVFTGPAPWDTRAALERAMAAIEVGHTYVELDNSLAGSALKENQIEAFSCYTTGGESPAPWVTEAMLTTPSTVLNLSDEEIEMLRDKDIETVRVSTDAFEGDMEVDEAVTVTLFYGFDVGTDFSEDEVYRMLTVIEEHADELAQADAGFNQIASDMVEMQRRGIQSAGDTVPIHPGLAKFLREKDAWDAAWDERVAKTS